MQRLMVTGGAGFIGSSFIRHVLGTDPSVHVTNLDALTYAGSLENLNDLPDPSRHELVRGDICDQSLVLQLLRDRGIEVIVHFAAESHVDRSIKGPMPFVHTNVVGTATLLEAARQVWLLERKMGKDTVRFHHISTDEVFGSLGPQDPPFSEHTPYAPNSPYAASKAASDHMVRAFAHTYGLPITITNCSNNYGPYQFPEKLIPLVILNALEGQPLPVYGDGLQVRDWLYVTDHCTAIWTVLREGQPGETYTIGGETQPTNLEIVRQLCAILDDLLPESRHSPHRNLARSVPDRPGHDRRYAMDTTKIRRELGWAPSETLESGLLKTVRWYLSNPEWVAASRQRPTFQDWLIRNYTSRGEER